MEAGPILRVCTPVQWRLNPGRMCRVDGQLLQPNFLWPATQVSLTLMSEIASGLTL